MKPIKNPKWLAPIFHIALLSSLNPQLSTCFAQGSLTPPGAPAPTFKTLSQIEPRTAITNTGAVTIPASGSYYLTTNINVSGGDAITITADNVTLDLNGFTVSSTEASPTGTGILLSGGRRHIHILNGHIKGNVTFSGGMYTGSGFAYGIRDSAASPGNVRVSGVSVSGCRMDGINLQATVSSVAESCTVQTVGGNGIFAGSVSQSTAKLCGLTGISATTASDCLGDSTGNSPGVGASHAQNCAGTSQGSGVGVNATTALNCAGTSFGFGDGVRANIAQNCYGTSFSSGNGVTADTADNCSGSSADSGNGVDADTATNCKGYSGGSGAGVSARSAHNCYGQSASGSGAGGAGVSASIAHGCYGQNSSGGPGVSAFSAHNCYGQSSSGAGVSANSAHNCYGQSSSGAGVNAASAQNCYGQSNSGNGVTSASVAENCRGISFGSAYGVQANVAFNCYGDSGAGGHGVHFDLIGAMCYGFTTGTGYNYVLGGGLAGPLNLP